MSGGHFGYGQYKINDIADEISRLIESNDDDTEGRHYSKETIAEFKLAKLFMKAAAIYAQRIDWLVSGDDGEDTFHERLKEELEKLEKLISLRAR